MGGGTHALLTQRNQFTARINSDVRSGAINQTTGTRLKADYAALVDLETRYGSDRRFTADERADLARRYEALSRVLADGRYADPASEVASVVAGKADFDRRVDTAVSARRLSRTAGSRLKADYAALIQVEAGYLRDGQITAREREDLDSRLDALDARIGDVGYGNGTTVQTPRVRLDAVLRRLPYSGLSAAAQTQLRIEHGDLDRLAAAYERLVPSADDRTYLERRVGELETRAKMRR